MGWQASVARVERRRDESAGRPRKLSYNEQRELGQLPPQIEQLETLLADLQQGISAPDFYSQDHDIVQPVLAKLEATQAALDQSIERWTELEDRQLEYRQNRVPPKPT